MLRRIGPRLRAGDTQPKMSPSSPKTPGLAPSWAGGKAMAKPVPGSWGWPRHAWGIPHSPWLSLSLWGPPWPVPRGSGSFRGTGMGTGRWDGRGGT